MAGTKDQKVEAVVLTESVGAVGMTLVEYAETHDIVINRGSGPPPRPTAGGDTNALLVGEAAAVALATLQQSMAASMGRAFTNAVHNQLAVGTVGRASATRCANLLLMLATAQPRVRL